MHQAAIVVYLFSACCRFSSYPVILAVRSILAAPLGACMQSNVFVGNLAKNPTLSGNGDRAYCRFTLFIAERVQFGAPGKEKREHLAENQGSND
ncbi:hypothetical protein [Xanthomonas hortorum]|uniref:hypothetical protein n=2 Tax=Xanthomonas TaxID=338 RepID=UPI0032E8D231